MAYEDFTTYTESDPESDITVTSTKVDVDAIYRKVQSGYVRKDFGEDYFSADFEIDIEVQVTAMDLYTSHFFFVLCDAAANDFQADISYSENNSLLVWCNYGYKYPEGTGYLLTLSTGDYTLTYSVLIRWR